MDSTLPLRHVGGVVMRALIPILGVLFLHWSAGNLLIVYFADTLASFFSVSVLAVGRLSGVDKESGPAWYRRLSTGAQLAGSGAMLAVILALVPFGFLLFMLLVEDFEWRFALHDRDLWIGVAAQFCAAVTLLLREYRRIEANANEEGHLYGSVNANEIAAALKGAGFHITTDQVRLEGPLKELGLYTVKIHLHADIECAEFHGTEGSAGVTWYLEPPRRSHHRPCPAARPPTGARGSVRTSVERSPLSLRPTLDRIGSAPCQS